MNSIFIDQLLICTLCLISASSEVSVNDPCVFGKAQCKCQKINSGILIDCSHQSLLEVPSGLPQETVYLDLSHNEIWQLTNHTLSTLEKLETLDLGFNALSHIESNGFQGLKALQTLYLRNNDLLFIDTVGENISFFKPLSSLIQLDIRNNSLKQNMYPSEMWKYLPRLEYLMLDGYPVTNLSDGFSHLHSLKHLSFDSGRCKIIKLGQGMFDALSNISLQTLDVSHCSIDIVDEDIFEPLHSLETFIVVGNPLQRAVCKIIKGIKNTNVQHLYLNNTDIGSEMMNILENLKDVNVRTLAFDSNSIYDLSVDYRMYIPNVEHLSFADNYMYGHAETTLSILSLHNLTSLNICCMFRYNTHKENRPTSHLKTSLQHFCEAGLACPLVLPPKLELVDMSQYGLHFSTVPELVVMTENRFKYLIATNTRVLALRHPIYCLHESFVELFDYSENSMSAFDKQVLDKCDWSRLKVLRLGGNPIGHELANTSETFLMNVPGLQILNLTDCNINTIRKQVFKVQNDLTHLHLGYNLLSDLDFNISHMLNLQLINVSHNQIKCFSNNTINMMNLLLQKNKQLKIDLSDNNLACSCECKDFIEWVLKNTNIFINLKNYHCTYKNHKISSFTELGAIVSELRSDCNDMKWLVIPLVLTIIILIAETLGFVIFRFRYDILYMYYSYRAKGQKIRFLESMFKYDAFVGYNIRDYEWVRYCLYKTLEESSGEFSFCFHHKDFIVGATIVDNILDAIDNSRHTILVVSNASLASEWWQFEVNMAHQASMQRQRNMIICVFLETIDDKLLPTSISRMLNVFTCIRWAQTKQGQKIFWAKLRAALNRYRDRNGKN